MEEIEAGKLLDVFFNPKKANPKWDAIDRVDKYISTLSNRVWGGFV